MATLATTSTSPSAVHEKIAKGPGIAGTLIFVAVLVVGVGYSGWNLVRDLSELRTGSARPRLRLGIALFVALGFEFGHGFQDRAHAAETVIRTHYLHRHMALTWR